MVVTYVLLLDKVPTDVRISESRGFRKCWYRCVNLNAANALPSPRTHKAIANDCLHLPYTWLSINLSLNKGLLRFGSPINVLSWFLLKMKNSPALLADILAFYFHLSIADERKLVFVNPWARLWQLPTLI